MTVVIRDSDSTVVIEDGGRGQKGDDGDPGLSGIKTHIHTSDFGLGKGVLSDQQAIEDALTAALGLVTEQELDRPGRGVGIEFSAGVWEFDAHVVGSGSALPIVAPGNANEGGSFWFYGQANGATTLTLPDRGVDPVTGRPLGCLGHALDLLNVGRGPAYDARCPDGNSFIAQCQDVDGNPTPHLAEVGQVFRITQMSRGRPVHNHYSVLRVIDATTFLWKMGGLEDPNRPGRSRPYGGDLNLLIPPLEYPEYVVPGIAAMVPNTVYFLDYFFEPLEFRQPHYLWLDKMQIMSGSDTGTPLDGIGWRQTSRVMALPDFGYNNWYFGKVRNGTPHGGQGPQNTDHNWDYAKQALGNRWQCGWIDNSSASYFRKPYSNTEDPVGLGGGRDNHDTDVNYGGTARGVHLFNDAGNFETFDTGGLNNWQAASYPMYAEGVDGVDRVENTIVDGWTGSVKIEGPGNASLLYDESKRGRVQKAVKLGIRMEAGMSINGADTGTPGGLGSTAQGTFTDKTDKPWPATDISLTTIDGMPTITATVPRAMFGSDGGLEKGTIVAIGQCWRGSLMGAPYAEDGRTIVGLGVKVWRGDWAGSADYKVGDGVVDAGVQYVCILDHTTAHAPPNATYWSTNLALFRSATANLTADDDGLRIDSPNLDGGSDTVAHVVGDDEAVMTNDIVTASTLQEWMVKNDGTKTQSSVCHEGRVASFEDSGGGLVTITLPYPIYPGPDLPSIELPGPYLGMVGDLCHMRTGELHTWNLQAVFDTQSLDRMTGSQRFFDVRSVRPGVLDLVLEDSKPSVRRTLPSWRIWDAISKTGTCTSDGTDVIEDLSGPWCPLDEGKVVDGTNVQNNTTVDEFIDPQHLKLTKTVAAGTGAWKLGMTKGLLPFRYAIRRGTQEFELFAHDPFDTNPIDQGDYVEYATTRGNSLAVRRSQADPETAGAGFAMSGSPALSEAAVEAVGDIGENSARVLLRGSTVIVAKEGTILTRPTSDDPDRPVSDDPNAFVAAATIPGGEINPGVVYDNGDGKVTVRIPGTNQRKVARATEHEDEGEPVGGVILAEEWTKSAINGGTP